MEERTDEPSGREKSAFPRSGISARKRGDGVRAAVLAATLDLLGQRGYEAMTTKDIASVAGVNEVTLFRRWGTKAAIVADALQYYSATETPTPDTGSLQTDLLELLRGIITRIQTPLGKVIDQIVVGHYPQPELEEVRRAYWRDRFNRAEALIQRAKDRGELPEEVNAHFLVEAAIGPILVRANATDQPLDEQLPEQIVALLLFGARSTKGS
ncbi:TetR/AcrR family transcriptional regulator [Ktedonosporobacter rubrisoli]|uniref:TetR/AcrR family transcriptional regulator n=1 Tax=Ktedonosporobacter rubrisoli TaxID=2509675 RepID=A0A4P6JMP1_KTERU|nr:TetR/AcrR family transcriptional regulator [Ktedonosporobacter rubrisoli]QBD75956.1 TetR/AcrR family transcriptional regulator [Ktedonosporobacter rubrisoli]